MADDTVGKCASSRGPVHLCGSRDARSALCRVLVGRPRTGRGRGALVLDEPAVVYVN